MGRSQREKGKRGERAAAKALSAIGFQAARGVQYQGGKESADIVVSVPGVHWEVKFVEREQVRQWIKQATDDAGGLVPVVLHKKSRQPWLVTLPLERLYEFCTRLATAITEEVQGLGTGEVPPALPDQVLHPAALGAPGLQQQLPTRVL